MEEPQIRYFTLENRGVVGHGLSRDEAVVERRVAWQGPHILQVFLQRHGASDQEIARSRRADAMPTDQSGGAKELRERGVYPLAWRPVHVCLNEAREQAICPRQLSHTALGLRAGECRELKLIPPPDEGFKTLGVDMPTQGTREGGCICGLASLFGKVKRPL